MTTQAVAAGSRHAALVTDLPRTPSKAPGDGAPGDGDLFAPVAGVTIERYARITAELLRRGLTDRQAIDAFAGTFGVAPGAWPGIQAMWIARMRRDPQVRRRYVELLGRG